MNKDLVLREYLAIERTRLANERTLLTYIRTALYFLVAGSTLGHLINTSFWQIMGTPLMILSAIITMLGIIRFVRTTRLIGQSKKQIGNASAEYIKSIVNEDVD